MDVIRCCVGVIGVSLRVADCGSASVIVTSCGCAEDLAALLAAAAAAAAAVVTSGEPNLETYQPSELVAVDSASIREMCSRMNVQKVQASHLLLAGVWCHLSGRTLPRHLLAVLALGPIPSAVQRYAKVLGDRSLVLYLGLEKGYSMAEGSVLATGKV